MARDITLPAQRGPALYYVGSERGDGTDTVTRIDLGAIHLDPTAIDVALRERVLCRALLLHAIELLDRSEPVQRAVMGAGVGPVSAVCAALAFLFAFAVFTHPGEVHYTHPVVRSSR